MRYQHYLARLRVPPLLEEMRTDILPMERDPKEALLGEILGEVRS